LPVAPLRTFSIAWSRRLLAATNISSPLAILHPAGSWNFVISLPYCSNPSCLSLAKTSILGPGHTRLTVS
jgi:hypothetical protein